MALMGAWVPLLVAGFVASLVVLAYAFQNRDQRGATALILLFSGVGVWLLSEFVQMQTGADPAAYGGFGLRQLGIELTTLGVLLVGLAFAGRQDLIRWDVLALLSIKPILWVGMAFLRPELLIDTETVESVPWGYVIDGTLLWMGGVSYAIALVLVAFGLLTVMMWRANYTFRWTIFSLMISIAVPLVTVSLYYLELTNIDMAPATFLFSSLVVLYAISRWQLMDATPIARRTVLEQMEDYVFVLDEDGVVTTANAAANETFDGTDDLTGLHIANILGEETLGDPSQDELSTERSVGINGDTCRLDIDKRVLTDYKGDLLAQLVFCRDITEKYKRKEELELLKDVRSRFLRHNLRNELNVIQAHAQLMLDDEGTPREESYNTIIETGDRLSDWAEKARDIERLIEKGDAEAHDVCTIMEEVMEEIDKRHVDVEFENECEESSIALTVPQVKGAFKDLLDNAARYNDADDPWVRVTTQTEADTVTVTVEDNGPGIDESELEAIESGEETQLEHSSGFGLWFAYWVVTTSGGEMSFDTTNGTTVEMTFDRAEIQGDTLDETGTVGGFVAADGARK